jgi:hypothetical protein
LTGYLFKKYLEGSGKGASLFAGALLGVGGYFLGIRKDMGWRAQGTDIILLGDPVGEFSRGLICWGLVKTL